MSSNNKDANDLIKKVLKDVKEMSSLNQVLVGGAAGLTTGYVLSKVGKIAAFTVGTSVILLQVAQSSGNILIYKFEMILTNLVDPTGYIEIKWGKKSKIEQLKKKAIAAAEEVGLTRHEENKTKLEKAFKEAKVFLENNLTFGASFIGGVLIGFSI